MKLIYKLLISLILLVLLAVAVSAEDRITVVLDPGHGGKDPGTIVGTRYESEYINDITALLKEYLEETGKFNVIVTRTENEYLKYLPRALVAHSADADILISLHFNSGDTPYKHGVEVLASVLDEWYPEKLSKSITASISSATGLADGGVVRKADTGDERGIYYWHDDIQWDIPGPATSRKSDYYSMISWGTKLGFPAIIVEHGYLSNAGDLAVCDTSEGLEKMARAEADAIIEYYTGHEHVYGELTCDRRANCCLEGVFSRKCTVCGHRTDVTRTPADSSCHGFTTESLSASCTTDGYVSRECQIARNLREKGLPNTPEHKEYEHIPAYGHNVTLELERLAGHAVDGYKKESCINCGEVWEYFTAGDPHIFVCDELPLGCDAESSEVTFVCTVCNAQELRTAEIPPHSFESVEKLDADCETDGYEKLRCTVCSFEKTETIAALGHDYGDGPGDIRCDHPEASIIYTCRRCKENFTETLVIPPHSFESVEKLDADCETDGYEKLRCTVCSFEKTDTFPAFGHDYGEGETVREAGAFRAGEIKYQCRHDASHVKTESLPRKWGEFFGIVAAVSLILFAVCAVAFLFIRAGKRRLSEISAEAAVSAEGAFEESDAEAAQSTESETKV